ncbi:septation protein SepH [Agromyces atrinae]|uniref:septation protein SepH n=1 Tax=Agromyces atrinae TaxID=592376 RepID=UPI001F5A39F1|nr:septation protein SepH [Agromyces atrinae]MCI2958927.1 septation protein SepH [Agromyces atrinae]
MQELKVIGVENGALVAASDEGARFRIAIDEVLQSRLRQAKTDKSHGPRLSPREIQAHIRAGLSAEEVAAVTGADVEDIERFEGPVLAEREHMVTSALGVPVHVGHDIDPTDDSSTFGTVIRERLARLDASGERWASWKDEERGWIIKLEFTADEIDHDARWGFEPRKNALLPINSEAITLSQQGDVKGGLIPRLRAVGSDGSSDESRFDSGAFTFADDESSASDTAPQFEPIPYGRSSTNAASDAAIKRAEEPKQNLSETADLLEALRRRRGEREALTPAVHTPATPAQTTTEVPLDTFDDETPSTEEQAPTARQASAALWGGKGVSASSTDQAASSSPRAAARKGRASMPSWDEIVFGARTDDDLA